MNTLDTNKPLFRCRRTKSTSASKLTRNQVETFKNKKIHNMQKKNNLVIIQKKKPNHKNQFLENQRSPDQSKSSVYEQKKSERSLSDKDSQITEKKHYCQGTFQEILERLESKQDRIMQILEEKKFSWEEKIAQKNNKKWIEQHLEYEKIIKKHKLEICTQISQQYGFNLMDNFQKTIENQLKLPKIKQKKEEKEQKEQKEKLKLVQKLFLKIMSNTANKKKQSSERNLCQLLTFRFWFKNINFSCFAEQMLEFQESITKQQFQKVLEKEPWMLKVTQIGFLVQRAAQNKLFVSKSSETVFKIVNFLRLFVKDFSIISQSMRAVKISMLKKFFLSKSSKIISELENKSYSDLIAVKEILVTLNEFHLKEDETNLFLANVCNCFEELNELPFKEIFSLKWINRMC